MLKSYISKLGILVVICLCLFQTVTADVQVTTGGVYFPDSNIILGPSSQIFTNITPLPTASETLIYVGTDFINFSATHDTTVTDLLHSSSEWNFTGSSTAGTLSITSSSEENRKYEFMVDGSINSIEYGNGHVSFSYGSWSTHTFAIRLSSGVYIYEWWNSATTDTYLKPKISEGQSIQFIITQYSGTGSVTFHWFKEGVDQSNNATFFTTSWASWGDNAEIICYLTDDLGQSRNITWDPVVTLLKATGSAEAVDTTRPNQFIDAVKALDLEEMMNAEMNMYTDLMGPLFFLLILGIPFVMIWIRSESLVIPGGLGIIVGTILILFMPTPYQAPIILIITISIISIMVGIYKERR